MRHAEFVGEHVYTVDELIDCFIDGCALLLHFIELLGGLVENGLHLSGV